MRHPMDQLSTERWVIDVCRQLKLPVGAADDDIFDAGGTSLTIMRLVARAENDFGPEVISPDEIVEASSVRDIASIIRLNVLQNASTAREAT
jgi:Phosphopantetheine attachment site